MSKKKAGKSFKDYKITLADQDRIIPVYEFAREISRGLGAIGALMTDESYVGDFGASKRKVSALAKKLGIEFDNDTTMWQAATDLAAKRKKANK